MIPRLDAVFGGVEPAAAIKIVVCVAPLYCSLFCCPLMEASFSFMCVGAAGRISPSSFILGSVLCVVACSVLSVWAVGPLSGFNQFSLLLVWCFCRCFSVDVVWFATSLVGVISGDSLRGLPTRSLGGRILFICSVIFCG
jgi:hypothetical protein